MCLVVWAMSAPVWTGCAPSAEVKAERPSAEDQSSSSTSDPVEDGGADDGPEDSEDAPEDSQDQDGSDDSEAPTEPADGDEPEEEEGRPEGDAAVLVSATLPTAMACGDVSPARVTMRNVGTTTWSRDSAYKLGMVDDEDPFYSADTRVWLPEGIEVPPGNTWTFTFEMSAPGADGVYISDWQMVREYVGWFGDVVDTEVNVACGEDGGGTAGWTVEGCARNGAEICDDEVFGIEPGYRYALSCVGPRGGIGYVSRNTGPRMSDGMERCQGWEERGEDAWDSLDYVHSFVCSTERVVEVDLDAWSGGYLWFGAHDHPDGGGHLTEICMVSRPD